MNVNENTGASQSTAWINIQSEMYYLLAKAVEMRKKYRKPKVITKKGIKLEMEIK